MNMSKSTMARYRKGVVTGVGWVAGLIALGVLHGTALVVAEAVVAVAGTAGVVAVPNAPKAPASVG